MKKEYRIITESEKKVLLKEQKEVAENREKIEHQLRLLEACVGSSEAKGIYERIKNEAYAQVLANSEYIIIKLNEALSDLENKHITERYKTLGI